MRTNDTDSSAIVAVEGNEVGSTERTRILREYERRRGAVDKSRYAPWESAEVLMRAERKHLAARLLHRWDVFPHATDLCLEVGFGELGWLGELITWGVEEPRLCGIELQQSRVAAAQRVLPSADLRLGDATHLPWPDDTFRLVIASTVFTSILDNGMRRRVADEMVRVLAPGGALLWYDFAVNNPRNPGVRRVGRHELRVLFPQLQGTVRSLTLAPPLARLIAPRSWWLATCLQAIPLLRTHLLAVLVKPAS